MRLAVFGNLVKEVFSEADHIIVILLVETALQNIVIGQGGETVVVSGQFEPFRGFLEILLGIVDIPQRIIGGGRVVGVRKSAGAAQEAFCPVPFSLGEGAVSQLIGIFRLLGLL